VHHIGNGATLQRIYRTNAFQVIAKADIVKVVQIGNHTGILCISPISNERNRVGFLTGPKAAQQFPRLTFQVDEYLISGFGIAVFRRRQAASPLPDSLD
jgi:hypothetical protein